MSKIDFEYLVQKIGTNIKKHHAVIRKTISIITRLAIAFTFLATEEPYTFLMYLFRVSDCPISHFVPEACAALMQEMTEKLG